MKRAAFVILAVAGLSGCASDLREVNKEPAMSPVGSGIADSSAAAYRYPETPSKPVKRYSLWDDRQSRLFTDSRAYQEGDILTVKIRINDSAKFKNQNDRSRTANRTLGASLDAEWEGAGTGGSLSGSADSKTETKGAGTIERSESIDLNVAAVVTAVLPNGNLMIKGSQEVRVNAELRVLTVAGIVRPSDIGGENTISYERIAEARISYGGRGRVSEIQQPPYGQQIADQILPF